MKYKIVFEQKQILIFHKVIFFLAYNNISLELVMFNS